MAGSAYTEIGRLSGLRGNDAATLPKVARQFESMFVDMMLKAAREATAVLAEGNPFESFETRLHGEMLDHQLALSMSENGGIGLADVLMRQLGGHPPAASVSDHAEGLSLQLPGRSGALAAADASNVNRAPGDGVQQRAGRSATAHGQRSVTEKQHAYSDPVDFVRRVLPAVRRATAGTALSPVAVLAQAALETGWGKAVIGDGAGGSSHNLFGIKSTGGWRGASASVKTVEVRDGIAGLEQAAFRVYDSLDHAVGDLVHTLQGAVRYQDALKAPDAAGYAEAIGRSGYATDPSYGRKLQGILSGETLQNALRTVLAEETARGAAAQADR